MKAPTQPLPIDGRKNYVLPCPSRVLVVPDAHVPHHDENALELTLAYGEKEKATVILLNGDFGDFYQLSEFDRDPARRYQLLDDIRAIQKELTALRRRFPKAEIIYKLGNHEDRMRRYIWSHSPELSSHPFMTLEALVDLASYGIKVVPAHAKMKLSSLHIIHGHEYRTGYKGGLTSPATTLFRKAKANTICSHHHQSTIHSERAIDESTITCWTTGCLCDLSPTWNPLNNWNHGFAFVEAIDSKRFQCHNLKIINGRVCE